MRKNKILYVVILLTIIAISSLFYRFMMDHVLSNFAQMGYHTKKVISGVISFLTGFFLAGAFRKYYVLKN